MNYENKVLTQSFLFDIMLNYHLSQNFKLIENYEFNYLTNILLDPISKDHI